MAYAYWSEGRENHHAVFDLFFRKNPFKGEFCIFSGLQEVIHFVETFRFEEYSFSKFNIVHVDLLLIILIISKKLCQIVKLNFLIG